MAFNVDDNVKVQKKGGQSGAKALTPEFNCVVTEVLGEGQYRVRPVYTVMVGRFDSFFKKFVVSESDMTAA